MLAKDAEMIALPSLDSADDASGEVFIVVVIDQARARLDAR